MAQRIQTRRIAGILGVFCVGVSAWLLFPRPTTDAEERRAPVCVCLVDASGSVRRTRPDWVRWVRNALAEEARASQAAGERFAVVSFASEVGVSFPLADPGAFLERLRGRGGRPFDPRAVAGADDASELARAVEVACELGSTATQRLQRLVLLGPGEHTGSEPRPYLARARRLGAGFSRRPPPEPELSDLALRELELPRTIEAGAPLAGRVTLAFERGRAPVERAFLEVEVENAGEVRRSVVELDLPAGRTVAELELPLACGPAGFGRTEVRLRVRQEPGPDPTPENDVVRRGTHAEGELVMAVVAQPDRLAAARDWLTPSGNSALPGLQFVFVTPARLSAVLAECDALVSYDLKVRELPALLVEDFVLRGGGGWFATSGWRFLEDWVPGEPPAGLAGLLPLEPAPLERGPRDVVLLVDGSGSMEGEPFETVRAACLDLVAAALPSDEVSLRFFTAGLEEPHSLKPRSSGVGADRTGAAEAAQRLLDLRVPNGETFLLRSLERFAETRRGLERDALVLLLTDGKEREGMERPDLRAASVLATLGELRATLRVIAVGEEASLGFLSYLTAPGEEVARPEDLEELRALFRREISGAQWRAGDALPVRWNGRWSGAAGESLAAEVRGGGDPPAIPAVERLIKNRVRPGAEALWIDDERAAVLGVQRVGLGRTALASTHPGEGWAPAWSGRLGRGEPAAFASLLRWLGRGTRRREEGLRVRREGQALVLTGLDAAWPAVVEGRLVDAAAEPDGSERGSERGGERGSELGRLRFTPPARAGEGDPLSRRHAALSGPLLERLRAGRALLVIERPPASGSPDGGVWIEPLDLGPPAEYAGLERSLDGDAGEGAPVGGKPLSRVLEPHPWAPGWLLAGLLLLAGAAVARGRGQGIASSGR